MQIKTSGSSVHKFSNGIMHTILFIISLSTILPILLIIAVSISKESDITKYGYSLLPRHISMLAYKMIFSDTGQLVNSYAVTICVTLLGTVIAIWLISSFAYVITRRDYKYRNILSFYIFFTMLFNGGLVPAYILIAQWLHMKNTIFALIVPYFVNAFFVLVMKGFLQTIPESLFESAKIDGAGELGIFVKIVLPLSKPALATVGLFLVLQYWNDWFLCLLYIENQKLFSLQYLLIRVLKNLEFLNSGGASQNLKITAVDVPTLSARMAMCILAAGPMLLVFPFFQKYFVKGLTIGSVKG